MHVSDLTVFFRPSGVAVIGASREQQKLGHGVVRNLQSVRYHGPVYPVNPHEDEILGYRAYPSIEKVPDPVDLAVIVVPAPRVAAQIEACGKRGIKGAITAGEKATGLAPNDEAGGDDMSGQDKQRSRKAPRRPRTAKGR